MPNAEMAREPRALLLGAPPRGWLLAGWALLPLRGFLALTFLYAGVQKLANPLFWNPASPYSLHSMMFSYARTSPIRFLLNPLLHDTTAVGLVIAIGELAVGIGLAVGLWTRIAAAGGIVISLCLFLAVSFHSSPWYTGADIVYLFALTPLLVAGSGGVLSVDALIARRVADESKLGDPRVVVLDFAVAQRSCGSYHKGDCLAIANRRCAPAGCPWLEGARPSLIVRRHPDDVDRRAVVIGGAAAVGAATLGAVTAGAAAGLGRLVGGAKHASVPQNSLPNGGSGKHGTLIGKASDVPAGTEGTFTVPGGSGDPGIVIQDSANHFVAYDAVCPHLGCTVAYQPSADIIACPCHGSEFLVSSGEVVQGPAPKGLTALTVTAENGNLYVK